MKYLILILLFSFNSYADTKVDVVNNVNGRTFGTTFKTQTETNTWIAKRISIDSWGKKERWEVYETQVTCMVIEDVTRLVDDLTIPYPDPVAVVDIDGNPVLDSFGNPTFEPYTHPQVSIVDHQRCRMPVEYTITETDITLEVQAAKAKRDADDLRKTEIRDAVKTRNLTPTEMSDWIKIQEGI